MKIINYIFIGIIKGITKTLFLSFEYHDTIFKNVLNYYDNNSQFNELSNLVYIILIILIYRKELIKFIKNKNKKKSIFLIPIISILTSFIKININIKFLPILFLLSSLLFFIISKHKFKNENQLNNKIIYITCLIIIISNILKLNTPLLLLFYYTYNNISYKKSIKYCLLISCFLMKLPTPNSLINFNIYYLFGLIATATITLMIYSKISKINYFKISIYNLIISILIIIYYI